MELINWLDSELVTAINNRQVSEHGGAGASIRDKTTLESTLARPQQLFAYGDPSPDLPALAASLAFGLSRNHAFVDANKRTAYVAFLTFLALNDAEVIASPEDRYLQILSLAQGLISEGEFATWMRSVIK